MKVGVNGDQKLGAHRMQTSATNFSELMARVRDGSQEAAAELVAQYGEMVFNAVRKLFPQGLRRAFDSEDLVQVAWRSVFRHLSRLGRFETPAEFAAFLDTLATNKVRLEVRRRYGQKKHNVNRECPIGSQLDRFPDGGPTPSQMAIVQERWVQLYECQPARFQEVIRLKLKGHSPKEIASQVGLHEGSVRRILRNIHREMMP